MAPPDATALTAEALRSWPLPALDADDDKHERGTVLVVGGEVSTPGAVVLAGMAALRAGAGRLQVATVPETSVAVGVALPEAKSMGLPLQDLGGVELDGVDAVLVGPGLLSADDTAAVLGKLLPRLDGRAVVVDALALTALEGPLVGPAVLTPNANELGALADDEGDLAALAGRVAAERAAAVVTQGWVAAPDGRAWRIDAGSVGLATSGSGDVLAGLALGLLGRGADPAQAACWAGWLHSAAGDRLSQTHGRTGFLARELLDAVADELRELTA